MTMMESIDHAISGPARKLSDYAHRRKKGADTKLAGELCVAGNLAIILDVAFIGAFIFVSYATRAARHSCSGYVVTPLGSGAAGADTGLRVASSLRRACQLETAVFASAIILCILYFMTAIWQFFMVRNRKSRTTGSMSKV